MLITMRTSTNLGYCGPGRTGG